MQRKTLKIPKHNKDSDVDLPPCLQLKLETRPIFREGNMIHWASQKLPSDKCT